MENYTFLSVRDFACFFQGFRFSLIIVMVMIRQWVLRMGILELELDAVCVFFIVENGDFELVI